MATGGRCNRMSASVMLIVVFTAVTFYCFSTKTRGTIIHFRETNVYSRHRLNKNDLLREEFSELSAPKMHSEIDFKQRFLDYAKQDILHMTPPTYLPQLKNPCWYEHRNASEPRLRCLPFFMLLGQNKCGTSDLYPSILAHPDVIPARDKEPQFWARHRHCYCCGKLTYSFRCRRTKPWTWKAYVDFFSPSVNTITKLLASKDPVDNRRSTEIVTGEATPSNLWDNRWWWNYEVNQNDTEPPALTNAHYIRHFLPTLKMIIILRNPVTRLYSDYSFVSTGKTSPQLFHQEVLKEIGSFKNCLRYHDIRYCVYHNSFNESDVRSTARLHNGFYAIYIEEYFKLFPREQFHILRLEDYSKHKADEMKKIFQFLNLRDVEIQYANTRRNKGKKRKGDMLPETRRLLTEFYRPYTVQLADLLMNKMYLWLD